MWFRIWCADAAYIATKQAIDLCYTWRIVSVPLDGFHQWNHSRFYLEEATLPNWLYFILCLNVPSFNTKDYPLASSYVAGELIACVASTSHGFSLISLLLPDVWVSQYCPYWWKRLSCWYFDLPSQTWYTLLEHLIFWHHWSDVNNEQGEGSNTDLINLGFLVHMQWQKPLLWS